MYVAQEHRKWIDILCFGTATPASLARHCPWVVKLNRRCAALGRGAPHGHLTFASRPPHGPLTAPSRLSHGLLLTNERESRLGGTANLTRRARLGRHGVWHCQKTHAR